MKKKKILLTGAAGFIGSNFIRHVQYNNLPYKIIGIDNLSYLHCLQNIYRNDNHPFYTADITDSKLIDKIIQKEEPEYIVNLAAASHVDLSIESAVPFVQSNVVGTQVLIDLALKYNLEKIIQISTDEVLGSLGPSDSPWTESALPAPRNPYAASKYAAELMIQAAGITHGLKYNITRSCNNMGNRQRPINLIPKIIKNILNKEKVPIYGTGLASRSWISVTDHVNAILKVLENGSPGEIYNIDAGYEISNLELFNKICNIMGEGFDLLSFVPDRKAHDMRYACNSDKLKKIGWVHEIKFHDALESTISWYKNNEWFLKI